MLYVDNNEIARSAESFVQARFFRCDLTAVYWAVRCQSMCCRNSRGTPTNWKRMFERGPAKQ